MISNRYMLMGLVVMACGLQAEQAQTAKAAETTKKSNTAAVNKDINTNITIDQVVNSGAATVDLNVRYVNTMEAMQTSKKGTEIAGTLENKRQELTAEIKRLEQALNQSMTEFKSKEATMSSQARGTEEAKIVKMRRDFESTVKSSEDELKLAMQQATEELSIDVEKAITEIAKAEGYDIVADVYTGRTIYASNKAMITQDLVKTMDKKYVATNKKAEPKKAEVTA